MENQETALFKATNELKFFTVKELRIFKNLLSASKKNCSAKEQNEFGQMIVNMVNPSLKKHDLPYKIREKMSETQKGIQKLSPKTQNIIGILISIIFCVLGDNFCIPFCVSDIFSRILYGKSCFFKEGFTIFTII